MGQSTLYALDNLVLELNAEEPRREDLDRLLQELSWVRTSQLRLPNHVCTFPLARTPVNLEFRKTAVKYFGPMIFCGFEVDDDFYLTDGSSVFHLQPAKGEGYARLAPSFFAKPTLAQGKLLVFWSAQAPSTAGHL